MNINTQVVMDVHRLTTLDWYTHNAVISSDKSTAEEKINSWLKVFDIVVIDNPVEWGEIKAYLSKEFITFDELIGMFWDAVTDERKKVQKPPTTA